MRHSAPIIGFLAFLLLVTGTSDASQMDLIQLDVGGDPGAAFSGDCRIVSGKLPVKRYRIQGRVPAKYWLPGDAVSCSLQKSKMAERLEAKITRGNLIEVQQVSMPPLRWILITSSGPWGNAKGASSAARPLWQ
ncbi:hypothetical protein [uncultured Sneathiella sp.]|uniref:hypothetical protein n=1 Tax=uncultured Sneathiella sp. TaxID=879315 RepID=UPI0030EB2777|tara:strand:- start:17517 stop:17918 length:402 start_codon:yes stop_codon:yes gene_type:complete